MKLDSLGWREHEFLTQQKKEDDIVCFFFSDNEQQKIDNDNLPLDVYTPRIQAIKRAIVLVNKRFAVYYNFIIKI